MICLPEKDPNQFDLFSNDINFGPEPSTAFPPNMNDIMSELENPNAILPSPNIATIDAIEATIPGHILTLENELIGEIAVLNNELAGLVSPVDNTRIDEITMTELPALTTELAGLASPADDIRIFQISGLPIGSPRFDEVNEQLDFLKGVEDPGPLVLSLGFDFAQPPLFSPAALLPIPPGFAAMSTHLAPFSPGIPSLLSGFGGDPLQALGGASDMLNLARTHLNGITGAPFGALGSMGQANAINLLGMADSGNALQQHLGLGAIPDCGLLSSLMGMLTQLISPLIDLLTAFLAPILGPLADLLNLMSSALSFITNELLGLINLIQRLLNFANGGRLLNLSPCGLLSMAQIGSPGLISQVNSGIAWKNPDLPQIPTPGSLNLF